MSDAFTIRPATPRDFTIVKELLSEASLPIVDIRPTLEEFWIAEEANQAVGVIGLDVYHPYGLLRSMLVVPSHQSKGIAAALIQQLETRSAELELTTLYLITNTAEQYFSKKQFNRIERVMLPDSVAGSMEFNGLCPASSVIMRKTL